VKKAKEELIVVYVCNYIIIIFKEKLKSLELNFTEKQSELEKLEEERNKITKEKDEKSVENDILWKRLKTFEDSKINSENDISSQLKKNKKQEEDHEKQVKSLQETIKQLQQQVNSSSTANSQSNSSTSEKALMDREVKEMKRKLGFF
jgi:chromosome segregation ATPase